VVERQGIGIREHIYEKLKDFKEKEGFTSFNDAILYLLKRRELERGKENG